MRRMWRTKTWRRSRSIAGLCTTAGGSSCRSIGHEAQVSGAIAEEQGQRQNDAAADGPEAPEVPCQPSWSSSTLTSASRAAPRTTRPQRSPVASGPTGAGTSRRPRPSWHQTDGLGQGQQHTEGEGGSARAAGPAPIGSYCPVQHTDHQHEAPRAIPLAQPPADRRKRARPPHSTPP